jgi:hypothetical protein
VAIILQKESVKWKSSEGCNTDQAECTVFSMHLTGGEICISMSTVLTTEAVKRRPLAAQKTLRCMRIAMITNTGHPCLCCVLKFLIANLLRLDSLKKFNRYFM